MGDAEIDQQRVRRIRAAFGFGGRGETGESSYRVRQARGATFYTSRAQHEDLTVVVKRFPHRGTAVPGAAFVLVHGIGVSSRYFQPLAAALTAYGEVWLIDLPGHGAAPNPKRDVSLADHAAAVAAMLSAAGLQSPVLVGHSMGSQVVSVLAHTHPELADRVVLMAPTMEPSARTPGRAMRRLLLDTLREPPAVFLIAVTDYLIRCGLPYLLRQLPNLLDDRIEDRMPSLDARVLIVNGDRDRIVPDSWARQLAGYGSQAWYAQVPGPHVVMHTDPTGTARAIARFLDMVGILDAEGHSPAPIAGSDAVDGDD